MPGGLDSYAATVIADGPVGWYRFGEQAFSIATGGQDSQLLCLDSSASGNLNGQPNPNGNFLQYGSGVVANAPSLLLTRGTSNAGGSALFPSTATAATANIATGGTAQPAILQPTAAIAVEAWCTPNVCTTGSVRQVLAAYGSDAAAIAPYLLYHIGTTAVNHVFKFAVNIAGALSTAQALAPVIVAGTTYHVVGVYTGAAVLIYVNGVLQGTNPSTGSISFANAGGYGLALGNDPSLTDANLQGYLDEVAIYAKALSASRIAYHYRQGSTLLPFVWRH